MQNYTYELIKSRWELGGYDLQKMIEFCKNGDITEQEFFELTRYNFKGLMEVRKNQKEEWT